MRNLGGERRPGWYFLVQPLPLTWKTWRWGPFWNKEILRIICFWSFWPTKKKGFSLKTVYLLNLSSSIEPSFIEDLGSIAQLCPIPSWLTAVFCSEIHSIFMDIAIIFYSSYSSTSPLIILLVTVILFLFHPNFSFS